MVIPAEAAKPLTRAVGAKRARAKTPARADRPKNLRKPFPKLSGLRCEPDINSRLPDNF